MREGGTLSPQSMGGGRLAIDSNKGWLNWEIVEKMAIDIFLNKKVDKKMRLKN